MAELEVLARREPKVGGRGKRAQGLPVYAAALSVQHAEADVDSVTCALATARGEDG